MFMAVGMLVVQLAATRHDANLIGAGVLAASYLVRMVADSDRGLGVAPVGEPARLDRGAPPADRVAAAGVRPDRRARRRRWSSWRSGWRPDGTSGRARSASRDTPRPRTFLLGGQAGLTVRLTRPAVIGWIVALAATGLVFGLVAQAAGSALKGSPASSG